MKKEWSLSTAPAYLVDLSQPGALLEANEASRRGYNVSSYNPVHREVLYKLFGAPKF